MTVLLTLTTAGTDSGPFDLYSSSDAYTVLLNKYFTSFTVARCMHRA
jgi:hypothetical protein